MNYCSICSQPFYGDNWSCPTCGKGPPIIGGFPAFSPELALGGAGFRPEYFQELVQLESASFWFRARNRLIIWALNSFFSRQRDYLEIGCGTGFVLNAVADSFPNAKIFGSEIFSAGLAYTAHRVPRANLMQMDARAIPYREHFDVVGAFDVLEHIEEDTEVLGQVYKAVKPQGGLLLTVPQHPWLWSHQDEYACHVRRYTNDELRQKVQAAGFEVLYQTSFVSLLLPLMWMSRRFGTAAKDPEKLSELRSGRLTNTFLGKIMALELAAIRKGLRFPAGGSLLLVGRRI